MEKYFHILVLNPGSTSTKLSLYKNEKFIYENIIHSNTDLQQYKSIIEQYEYRKNNYLIFKNKSIDLNSINAVVGRGGLLKPLVSGTYKVNRKMVNHLSKGIYGEHASNLGAILAFDFSRTIAYQLI